MAVLAATSLILPTGTAQAVDSKAVSTSVYWNLKATSCGSYSSFTVMEGLVSDGTNLFVVFGVPSSNALHEKRGGTVLTTWSLANGTCLRATPNLDLGHANDIAYHPNYAGGGPTLLIPKGTKGGDNESIKNKIAVVRLNTYTQSADITMNGRKLSGLCYSSAAQKFVLRYDNDVYYYPEVNNAPKTSSESHFTVATISGTGEQGLDCSGSYVYSLRSIAGTTGKTNYIQQYSWAGSAIKNLTYASSTTLEPTNSSSVEIEGVFHIGDQFYMGINRNSGGQDTLNWLDW